jgi:uncharacterized protein (TIGR02145 family)
MIRMKNNSANSLKITAIMLFLVGLLAHNTHAQTSIILDPTCQNCPAATPTATVNSNAASPVPVPTPSCGTVAGTYKAGTALTAANLITLNMNVTTVSAWTITTAATNGMTFAGSGTFAATGAQTIVLTGTGMPLTSGTTVIPITYAGTSCGASITVASNAPTAAAPPQGAVNTGSLSGKTCFDVAISNDNANTCAALSARTPQKADFALAATNTQIYTFTPQGTVSNVRFSYVNTNGNVITNLVGGNTGNNITTAVTATATFNTALNAPATGLTNANALTADIYVIYNDGATGAGTDRQLKITPKVKDCTCCGAFSFANGALGGAKTWLEFMCHNLGADESKNPFIYQPAIYGGTYQWGRQTDGHEQLASKPTPTQSPTATPNHNYFINSSGEWSAAANINALWGDGLVEAFGAFTTSISQKKGPNDPCPAGWKVPSHKQWVSILVGYNGGPNSDGSVYSFPAAGAANVVSTAIDPAMPGAGANGLNFGPLLYLPFTGQRGGLSTLYIGTNGLYWSSTLQNNSTDNGATFSITGSSAGGKGLLHKNYGLAVRCVIDK